jgi:hypothetical protein
MPKLKSSPERHTFLKKLHIDKCVQAGLEPDIDYILLWENSKLATEMKETDPKWQKDNLEYDLRSTDWIIEKTKQNNVYAQNLYAALCNSYFIKNELWPLLTEKKWSCSWRYAAGIVANMQEKGDYIEWYCSGIQNTPDITDEEFYILSKEQQDSYIESKGYVEEGIVTDEIKQDLLTLGWTVLNRTKE